jgi:radical SAM protein with 4Fe4S-binding SPASM domain
MAAPPAQRRGSEARPRRFLPELFLQLHVTDHCDLTCAHCYMTRRETTHLSQDLFARALEQFQALCRAMPHARHWVQITGGEPLLHPQIGDLLRFARERVGTVKILTTGLSLSDEFVRVIAVPCRAAQVSLDGLPPTHDRLRGVGTFRGALAGVERLRRAGVFTSVKMTVSRANQQDILPLFEAVRESVDLFSISRLVPSGPEQADLLPEPQRYAQALDALNRIAEGDRRISQRDPWCGPYLARHRAARHFRGCSAGLNGLTVLETGEILPCRRLPIVIGHLQTTALLGAMRGPVARALRARRFEPPCGHCRWLRHCGGSRCIAYALAGRLGAADPDCPYFETFPAHTTGGGDHGPAASA